MARAWAVLAAAVLAAAAVAAATVASRAPLEQSWVLLEDNEADVVEAVGLALRYNITELQLSHSIIMDIDEINDDAARAERIRRYIDIIHSAGMTAVVWAHEFYVEGNRVCFDPADPFWESRRSAYRKALQTVPTIDGVVLMYGSSDLEPWDALCLCDFCRLNDTVPEPLRPFQIPSNPERVEQIARMVHDVVVDEFGKKLIIRTFIHATAEIWWVGEGLARARDLTLTAMSKDVPQDFEPYYPVDPLFGKLPHKHIMEVDAAGEYWGRSIVPFGAATYFERRIRELVPLGLTGYTARVSRSGSVVFGTPSEINIVALSRMSADPTVTTEAVTSEFVAARYGVDPASAAGIALGHAINLSFDVGRKMYYFLGFWALEKSSGLPSSLRETALLTGRSIARYDLDYADTYFHLLRPTLQTLVDLRQEKNEALALSRFAQSLLAQAAPALSAEDYETLRFQYRHQELCTEVWRHMAEVVWAFKALRQDNYNATELEAWIDAGLDGMTRTAVQIDAEIVPAQQYPCPAAEVRELVADLRDDIPALNRTERVQMVISPPTISVSAAGVATIELYTDAAVVVDLQYGLSLPLYDAGGRVAATAPGPKTVHVFQLPALPLESWYVFRAIALGAAPGGADLVGADWWVAIRPTFVRPGH